MNIKMPLLAVFLCTTVFVSYPSAGPMFQKQPELFGLETPPQISTEGEDVIDVLKSMAVEIQIQLEQGNTPLAKSLLVEALELAKANNVEPGEMYYRLAWQIKYDLRYMVYHPQRSNLTARIYHHA